MDSFELGDDLIRENSDLVFEKVCQRGYSIWYRIDRHGDEFRLLGPEEMSEYKKLLVQVRPGEQVIT